MDYPIFFSNDVVIDMMLGEEDDNDRLIKLVQSSTRVLMTSFRSKVEELCKCSNDIKKLVRVGYDIKIAKKAAKKLFGYNKGIPFLAIDGIESHDQRLDEYDSS
jgi:predicted methyltransferase